MRTNEELQKNVQDAIKCHPLLNLWEINVIAKDSVINLSGSVDSYANKLNAENAAKNVAGVKAVSETIKIEFKGSMNKTTDARISKEVMNAFECDLQIPIDKVITEVQGGWVTLSGELEWDYQGQAVEKILKIFLGLKGITNNLTIDPLHKMRSRKPDVHNLKVEYRIKNV